MNGVIILTGSKIATFVSVKTLIVKAESKSFQLQAQDDLASCSIDVNSMLN